MDSVFICSNIGDVCLCGRPADALCDAPRDYRHVPLVMVLRSKAFELTNALAKASPSEQRMIRHEIDGINREIRRAMADPNQATCSTPICHDCALEIGSDEHLCPAHAEDWQRARAEQAQHHAALMARGPGVLPADGWIVWGKVAHHLRKPDDVVAACKRQVRPGWRPARDERRCKGCAQ